MKLAGIVTPKQINQRGACIDLEQKAKRILDILHEALPHEREVILKLVTHAESVYD